MRAIASIHYPISKRKNSHRASWAFIWADLIKADVIHKNEPYSGYNEVFIYHGMEWSGSFNLFGGAKDVSEFQTFLDSNNKFTSLDIPMPDFGAIGKSRLNNCSEEWANFDWDALTAKCKSIDMVRMHDLHLNDLVVGDSHANSVYQSGYAVDRHDGKTLHGALKVGLIDMVEPYAANNKLKNITFNFGNIDIRHHSLRQPDGSEEALMSYYEEELKSVEDRYGSNIEVVAPIWIENESRKIPKSGWYDGTPFYGDWEDRDRMREFFSQRIEGMCIKNNWKFYQHSENFKNALGELDFEYMEKPQSVHLSPLSYRENIFQQHMQYK